ncbi:MAG: RnfABCDGE type electron transport complex subunit B, partial [Proteobacteria bacterium]|nr:RnfABCDGE type electron transport complex subunit B [Pseudomonadota bacterium]
MRGKRTTVALIDEPRCIGCALCIDACPVDAIVGARGLMHTVVEKLCIGCDLCLPACPVDCIDMMPAPGPWTTLDASAAKRRAAQRKRRLERLRPKSGKDRGQRRAVLA